MIGKFQNQFFFNPIDKIIKIIPRTRNGLYPIPIKQKKTPDNKSIFSKGSLERTSVFKFIKSNGHIGRSNHFFSIINFQIQNFYKNNQGEIAS